MCQTSFNKRIIAFDLLKCFAICLVIYGHVIQYMQPGNLLEKLPYVYIYAFHMPLFMCITGYFSLSSMQLTFSNLIKKKGKQLLLPALCWGGVEIMLFFIKWYVQGIEITIENVSFIFFGCLWYLKSAFICYCLYWFFNRYGRNIIMSFFCFVSTYTFCILLQVCLPNMDFNLIVMFPSFILGAFVRSRDIVKSVTWKRIIPLFVAFVLMMMYWDNTYWEIPRLLHDDLSQHVLLEYTMKYLFKIIIGLLGSLLFLFVFCRLFGKITDNNSMTHIFVSVGRNTLALYCVHAVIFDLVPLKKVGGVFSDIVFWILIAPIITIVLVILLQRITKYLQINKKLSLYFLGH